MQVEELSLNPISGTRPPYAVTGQLEVGHFQPRIDEFPPRINRPSDRFPWLSTNRVGGKNLGSGVPRRDRPYGEKSHCQR